MKNLKSNPKEKRINKSPPQKEEDRDYDEEEERDYDNDDDFSGIFDDYSLGIVDDDDYPCGEDDDVHNDPEPDLGFWGDFDKD